MKKIDDSSKNYFINRGLRLITIYEYFSFILWYVLRIIELLYKRLQQDASNYLTSQTVPVYDKEVSIIESVNKWFIPIAIVLLALVIIYAFISIKSKNNNSQKMENHLLIERKILITLMLLPILFIICMLFLRLF